MIIDSHQHFWYYQPSMNSWITDSMSVLRQDFLASDLEVVLMAHKVDGCIAVQANQSEEETLFLLDLASNHTFIKGVVGWVDLQDAAVEERLIFFKESIF